MSVFILVLQVEEFLSKCSHCEIWVNLSKLKTHLIGYHGFPGGQHELIQKTREVGREEKGRGGEGRGGEDSPKGGCLLLVYLTRP